MLYSITDFRNNYFMVILIRYDFKKISTNSAKNFFKSKKKIHFRLVDGRDVQMERRRGLVRYGGFLRLLPQGYRQLTSFGPLYIKRL